VTLDSPGPLDPAAEYMDANHLRRLWLGFCALEGAPNKLHFVREWVFPPAAYMRDRYPDVRLNWLPWLYALRLMGSYANVRTGTD
jgi:hypothetical protein